MTIQCSEKEGSATTMAGKNQLLSQSDIHEMVYLAAQSIAPVWPLKTFIACNSLRGFETRSFDEAMNEAEFLFNGNAYDYQHINRETIKWCENYFDEGQSTIDFPMDKKGFYATFKMLSQYDKKLHQGIKQNKQWLKQLPEFAEDAIIQCLEFLRISDKEHLSFLKKSLAQLPGWSGYIKWKTEWQNKPSDSDNKSDLMIDFIAVRLVITALIHPEINFSKTMRHHHETPHKAILDNITKLEDAYKSHLIPQMLAEATTMDGSMQKPVDAQLVFCIDVRSEPFRRKLEALGAYETLGFAGFFGLPVRLHDYNSGEVTDSCPVLLKPQYDIYDGPGHSHTCIQKNHDQGKRLLDGLTNVYQQLKYNFATPFALVETLGAWSGLLMLGKTLKPIFTIGLIKKWIERVKPEVPTVPKVDKFSADACASGIPESDQALYAETVLRMMGLTKEFGKFVVFCGHGSSTQNNPYASGLDCGACGGNHGGGNAKVLATILNKPSIRASLSERGLVIPQDTKFLAAEHNTTTDDLFIFHDQQPFIHEQTFKNLLAAIEIAKEKNAATRVKAFCGSELANAVEETKRRSQDWSEVRPEWGLARNAAFIVGPRSLTKNLDLEGRCFLHSYDWTQDKQLTALETILTAPMVVAEWINTQYLFSTIDNVTYGSGSKVTHNVTGKIGVMQGNGSDLMHGLPLQSVNASDDERYHQPQRLMTVIYAPRSSVSMIIQRHDILQTLFFNAWVHLVVIEPGENKAYQLQTYGDWRLLSDEPK